MPRAHSKMTLDRCRPSCQSLRAASQARVSAATVASLRAAWSCASRSSRPRRRAASRRASLCAWTAIGDRGGPRGARGTSATTDSARGVDGVAGAEGTAGAAGASRRGAGVSAGPDKDDSNRKRASALNIASSSFRLMMPAANFCLARAKWCNGQHYFERKRTHGKITYGIFDGSFRLHDVYVYKA